MTTTRTMSLGKFLTLGAGAALIAFASHTAHAITPTGDQAGPVPRSTKPVNFTPPTEASAAAPLELISGTIAAIDRAKKTMTVAGTALTWHNAKLRVFGANGVGMTDRELTPGMRVRFALEPGSKEGRAVVLIYVDAQP